MEVLYCRMCHSWTKDREEIYRAKIDENYCPICRSVGSFAIMELAEEDTIDDSFITQRISQNND